MFLTRNNSLCSKFPSHERDTTGSVPVINIYQSISAMPVYKNWSFEELRLKDYELGINKNKQSIPPQQLGFGGISNSGFGSQPPASSKLPHASLSIH